jgi:excinuclease ABC subunit C
MIVSMMDLADALKHVPNQPGIYRMYDANNTLIYIGKAKVLKNRVRSYFSGSHTPKVAAMVSQIARFEVLVTQTEVEALILEANLINTHKPKYNILLRDDKKYPWIALSDEAFPRLYVTRRPEKRGKTKYFGPYVSSGDLYATLAAIKRHFPLRQRRKPLFKTRPCMNFFIGTCSGPCQNKITPEGYQDIVKRVELFLKGKGDVLKPLLQTEMEAASEALNFERAARLRDAIAAVDTVVARQRVISPDEHLSMDVLTVATDGPRVVGVVLHIRGGKLIASRVHRLTRQGGFMPGIAGAADDPDEPATLLTRFILHHYANGHTTHDAADFPDSVVVPPCIPAEDEALLAQLLSQQAQKPLVFRAANRHKDLLAMAQQNAQEGLKQARFDDTASVQADPAQVLMALQEALNLPDFPRRIECYDISHFQGSQTVASMVVFVDARPDKAEYRRFKIECAEGKPDDFASMNEVIRRRFAHSGDQADAWDDPDLLIIDGGKGQLSAACDALNAHGLSDQPVVSLAKKFEEVFVPHQSRPVIIPRDSKVLFLLQQLRDEAHRFAITYHRQLRGKAATQSAISGIKGLGQKNKQLLLAHYGTIERMLAAPPQEIATVLGITVKRATTFYKHLEEGTRAQ